MPIIGTCCCQSGTPCCNCVAAANLARDWQFTIAGLTNAACGFCSQYNGTFTLKWVRNCTWVDWRMANPACGAFDEFGVPCAPHNTWKLDRVGGDLGDYRLIKNFSPFGVYQYFRAAVDWNCNGPNVMTFSGTPGTDCGNYPPQVTLTRPAPVIPVCECSPPYDAIAARWRVTFAGVMGLLCDCTPINAEHLLERNAAGCEGFCCWGKTILQPGCVIGNTELRLRVTDGLRADSIVYLLIAGRAGLDTRTNYWMPQASFNPVGANILSRFTACAAFQDEALCQDWPATVTILPG